MTALHVALRATTRDPELDVLTLAYLGSLHPASREASREFLGTLSHESRCDYLMRGVHRVFPQLGASVRTWPKLAAELERDAPKLVPPVRPFQTVYRREIHVSLWRIITFLDDVWVPSRLISLLERHGL